MNKNRQLITVCLLFLLISQIIGCAGSTQDKESEPVSNQSITNASDSDVSTYPVTVESCGESVTFESTPERALVFDTNMTEIMLALGLEDKIAGYWISGAQPISEKYQSQIEEIPLISEELWPPPGRELILSFDPDFVFGGWGWVYFEESGVTPERLAEAGIKSYTLTESCVEVGVQPDLTLESTYRDIINIGRIFGVEDRAQGIVNQMQTDIASIQAEIGDVETPIRALYYGGGSDAAFTGGRFAMPSRMMEIVGAENIFIDVEDDWIPEASWETIIERDPEVIIIDDTPWANGEDSIATLKSLPQLSSVSAIQNERFIVLPWTYLIPSLDIDEGITMLAQELYPDLFQE